MDLGRFRSGDAFVWLCAVFVAAIVLGGGTRSGFLSDVVLQLIAIPLLLWSSWRISEPDAGNSARKALFAAIIVVAVPLLQLIPLPPSLWTTLPNRGPIAQALELAGQSLPWMSLSIDPNATALSALSLVVPISIFLATVLLSYPQRRGLSLVVLGAGMLSVFVGLSQVAQGPSSSLRFFEFSNTTEAIGFFANRNHFAALLYSMTVLAAAWALEKSFGSSAAAVAARPLATANVVAALASFTVLVALVSAQAMARSRAGLGLTIVALLGAFGLAFSDRRATSGLSPSRVLLGALLVAATFATQFALYRIMERFADDPLKDARIAFARTTIEAAKSFMPFGAGMGSFVPVYALFEKPQDVLANTFANRAHDDVLELWLETGAVGLALMAIFLCWFVLRSFAVWKGGTEPPQGFDRSLVRAATLIIGLLALHSFVDYPLRTGAMMAIFAFACGLLIAPPSGDESLRAEPAKKGQRSGLQDWQAFAPAFGASEAAADNAPSATAPPAPMPAPRARWTDDREWPQEWRTPTSPPQSRS